VDCGRSRQDLVRRIYEADEATTRVDQGGPGPSGGHNGGSAVARPASS
jgi:hypothetical protein